MSVLYKTPHVKARHMSALCHCLIASTWHGLMSQNTRSAQLRNCTLV